MRSGESQNAETSLRRRPSPPAIQLQLKIHPLELVTVKRRLVPEHEIRSLLDMLKGEYGVQIGTVDVRVDGVTIYPPDPGPGPAPTSTETDYDRWKKNSNYGRPARRPETAKAR